MSNPNDRVRLRGPDTAIKGVGRGRLAVALSDVLSDGLSMVKVLRFRKRRALARHFMIRTISRAARRMGLSSSISAIGVGRPRARWITRAAFCRRSGSAATAEAGRGIGSSCLAMCAGLEMTSAPFARSLPQAGPRSRCSTLHCLVALLLACAG